jgi:hypothetical protein
VVVTSFVICGCVFVWICNVWMCVCMGFVMCGFFDNCVGVLTIYLFVFTMFCIIFTVFLYCLVHVYLFSFLTRVRTTASE